MSSASWPPGAEGGGIITSYTNDIVLAGRELSKTYGNMFTRGNVNALDHASFELRAGEICGLVGPNGAGKSTLIKLIMGIEPRSSGKLEIDDNGPTTIVGYVPERPTFFEDLSAYYNLLYIARLNRVPDAGQACRNALTEFGLGERGGDIVGTFSKGMKQRLAIARSVIHSPKVLIMDEPFSGLDPTMMLELRTILKQLKAKGLTMLISSHELNEIDQVCDSLIFIQTGRILKKEGFDRGEGKVTLQLIVLNPGVEITKCLGNRRIISVSKDGSAILVEATKEDVPDIVTAVVHAGGRIMETRIIQRTAEDMYADVFMPGVKK
jgi:ABC-2 type transport system ATP-binding protein